MPVCPKCGSQVPDGSKFCASCGSSVGAAPGAPGVPPSQPPSPGSAPGGGAGGIAPNVAAMLGYVPFCLIGLVCAILFGFVLEPYKQDRFIRFHAWQSLAMHGVFLVLWIGWMVVSFVLTFIARLFAVITFPISLLLGLAALIAFIFLMVKAYGNVSFKLPVLGDWAEKQANG